MNRIPSEKLRTKAFSLSFFLFLSILLPDCLLAKKTDPLPGMPGEYNVTWHSPSANCNGSMPLGNGDITVNAWVEPSGDLLFYIGKSDAWDDYGRLLKLGKVRLHLNPNPLLPGKPFIQTLSLNDATILVRYGDKEAATEIRLWVDASHPVIQIEVTGKKKSDATVSFEMWRTAPDTLSSIEVSDVYRKPSQSDPRYAPTVVEPDSVLTGSAKYIGWYHRNRKSVGPELCARIQGMTGFQRPDPLLDRTFGAVITAGHGTKQDDFHLVSYASAKHTFSIYALTMRPATRNTWMAAMDEIIRKTSLFSLTDRREAHEKWWAGFWNRSWIFVEPTNRNDSNAVNETHTVTRGYILQRFINACAGRGAYPIKFNGSLFTVPSPGQPGNADYRRWGPGYWWQNTRLPYISMCASGDFDLLQPLFNMYGKQLIPLFRYRTKRYLGHEGIYIPECIYFWGDMFSETYGWTPYEERTDKLQESRWHKWEWVSGPELVYMMLDYYEYSSDTEFLKEVLLPAAHDVLTFFDEQYKTDQNGKLVMHPAQSLETWWDCTNPMPEIAGLQAITDRLIGLPGNLVSPVEHVFWVNFKKKIPDLPTCTENGNKMLAAAADFRHKSNCENPELYAVFPFRRIAVGKPGLDLAVEALKYRTDKGNFGWRQDDIFMAYLGLADSARLYITQRAAQKNTESRFPAFWGPNYDWVPDQDHGSILLKTLQSMLLQADGKTIYLLPAWPAGWNARFKLHAPYQTIIQGSVVNGRLVGLQVQPENRKKDIIVLQP